MQNQTVKIGLLSALVFGASICVGMTLFGIREVSRIRAELPPVEKLVNFEPAQPTIVLSRDGQKIGEIFEERRYPVKLSQISPTLVHAFLAAEDAGFYKHSGVDYTGLLRGVKSYLTRQRNMQGGSTITQQLAKTVLLTREKTLERKLKDILLAFEIEKKMTKDDILELYLNTIFLGNNSYGVEAAARNYFRKSNTELTLAEAAIIAGVNSAPSAYAPTENLQRSKQRQKFVLEQMVKNGWATVKDANDAFKQALKVYRAEAPNTKAAPYFFMDVKKQLEQLQLKNLQSNGYEVYTTLDMRIQAQAQKIVTESLKQYDSRRGFKGAVKRHGSKFIEALTRVANAPLQENEDLRAIVVDLFPQIGAAAIVTSEGLGLLLEEDHRWALARSRNKESHLLDFANILAIGDEIHVKQHKRNTPNRIEKQKQKLQSLSSFFKYFEAPPPSQIQYYQLTDTEGVEAATVIMDSRTGDVLAMVGGSNFRNSQFNRATQARRQVGSSVKPLYYAYAIDQGFSPASKIASPPIVIGDWKPENYSKEFTGTTTLRSSLINSYNISSIQLFQSLGVGQVLKHLRLLGFDWPNEDLSVALGSGDATLLQMVRSYSPFANHGSLIEPRYIQKIVDKNGEVLFGENDARLRLDLSQLNKGNKKSTNQLSAKNLQNSKVLSPEAAYVTVKIMQDVVRFGTGTSVASVSPVAAGKTGTTNNYTDAWFMGVMPHLVAGVWVGFDDARKSLGSDGTGGQMAGPIWREVVRTALQHYPAPANWEEPAGISYVKIDQHSGDLSTGGGGIRIPVVSGTEPNSPKAKNALNMYDVTPANGNDAPPSSSTSDDLRQLN